MPPTYQKLKDPHIARFRSLKNFDRIIDEKTVRYSEEEIDSHEYLPCISLFDNLYMNYTISSPSGYGGGERTKIVGKRLFPEKFSQDTLFSRKKLNKDQLQEFNTTLQAISIWKIDQFEGVIQSTKCTIMTTNLLGLCDEYNQNNLGIINDDDDQCQNLAEAIGLQELQEDINNIGTAAFEVFPLLLDEPNNESNMRNEFENENETINILLITFPDLNYILNQRPVPQKQFETFDLLFIPKGFLYFKALIDT
ncbi:hypothetical protein C1645_820219 [Glomus cerebriforme]|uniref:Uncharacterized protein n=1 Tax=Glomus cerebriforme TaxID=658196 RepID=A0A397T8Y0_9GLOM|nr:hypothetical protein C1645_820219 [Glomus cerebriforme]